ncbi:hypothetical protein T4E_6501 [Trichinella pseudospiralis]|uniref:Retrovirus-related Pol polyprotein from transposon TNT 1-94 n=1 Tax=Trichinella pseudospiralis TaxID=6337 RepID=A0A0V0Y7F6_TRIPS|nr:hypothetical protein T4E_6501 [Trichinella pseudospiralis]
MIALLAGILFRYYTTAGTTQVFYLDTGTRTEVSRHSSDQKYSDAVVSLMPMMIYGKASRLLCRHLLYQASTKSFLNDRRVFFLSPSGCCSSTLPPP